MMKADRLVNSNMSNMRVMLIYLEPLENEPLGLMYIGTVLGKAGFAVKIIGIDRHDPEGRLFRQIRAFKPRVLGFSITTPMAGKAEKLAAGVKNNFPDITIISGGPHPTILPEETLKGKNVDFCVIGEGENTAVDLLQVLSASGPLEKVKGIAYVRNGGFIRTQGREYIENLDSLPFVNRDILPPEVIYGRSGYPVGNPCMLLMTVRGCPYQCSFCQPAVDKIFGRKVRRRSAGNVIKEIVELYNKYHIHGLWINDDTLLYDTNWTNDFCDSMLKEKLDILWHANGRINKADKDILIKMRQAGCVGIVMTPETGCERIRNEVLNKKISNDQVIEAYRICHEIGLPVQANIMLGSPTETEEDLESSLALIKKIQPHFMNYSFTTAMPGTYLYEKYAAEIGRSEYYLKYENYDITCLKKINVNISDDKLIRAADFFRKNYSNTSFSNRARHFFKYQYFRKILYKRWRTLIFSRHPKFRHFLFDLAAIIIGSLWFIKNKKIYEEG